MGYRSDDIGRVAVASSPCPVPPTRSIPIAMMKTAANGVVANGISLDRLLDCSGIEPADDCGEISATEYLLWFTVMGRELQDFTHGLASRGFSGLYSRILINLIMGSATLNSAIEAVRQLLKLSGAPVRIEMAIDGETASVRIRSEARDDRAAAVMEDTLIAWFWMCFRYFLGGAFVVESVRTRDPAHISIGKLHFWIMAPVRVGAVSSLSFPRHLLWMPRVADPVEKNPHWEILRGAVALFDRPVAPRPARPLDFETMARAAGVSNSTLRRRMKDSVGGFRQFRQSSIVEAGTMLLQGSDTSVDAIAVELGYSEARSFRRFMKSATGMTPDEIRGMRRASATPSGGAGSGYERLRDIAIQLDAVS